MRWFVIAVAVAGCGGDDVTRVPLADMTEVPTTVFVRHAATDGTFLGGTSRVNVEMDTGVIGCVSLPSDTRAVFGNESSFMSVALTMVDAEYNHIDDFCIGIGMYVDLDTALFATQPSHLVITDDSTTWTIVLAGTDADLTIAPVVAGAATTATWNGGPPIDEADFWYLDSKGHDAVISSQNQTSSTHIHDNSVDFDVPVDFPLQQVVEVELGATVTLGPTRDATGSSCAGPTQCSAELNVQKLAAVVQP